MLFSHSLHTVVQINNNLSGAISVALNNEKIININMHVHRKMYFSEHYTHTDMITTDFVSL